MFCSPEPATHLNVQKGSGEFVSPVCCTVTSNNRMGIVESLCDYLGKKIIFSNCICRTVVAVAYHDIRYALPTIIPNFDKLMINFKDMVFIDNAMKVNKKIDLAKSILFYLRPRVGTLHSFKRIRFCSVCMSLVNLGHRDGLPEKPHHISNT